MPPRPSVVMSLVVLARRPGTRRRSRSRRRRARSAIRPGVTSMIRALPCAESVITPAWEPVNERASRPRLAIAIASSAIEIRSPAVSSMSSSRAGGSGLTWLARSMQLVGGVAHRGDDDDHVVSPALRVATMRWATRLMPSASATDEPPYFCTTSATARACTSPAVVLIGPELTAVHAERAGVDPRLGSAAAGALLGDVQAGVRDHGVQRAQCGPAVGAPVVEVGVLPPPQRLERPAGLVVLRPWMRSAATAARSSESRNGRHAVSVVRVEHLGVLVDRGQPPARPVRSASRSGSAPTSGSQLPGRITSLLAPSCAPASRIWDTSSSSSGTVSSPPSPWASAATPSMKSLHARRRSGRRAAASSRRPASGGPVADGSDIKQSPSFERAPQRHLVGVLEVAPDRQSARGPGHPQAHRLDQPGQIGRGRLALQVGVGGEDQLGDRCRRRAAPSAP